VAPGDDVSPPLGFGAADQNTLDEPVWETAKRDLRRIYKNLVMVVFPFKDRSQQSAALRNWDLWGPMIFTLGLAIALSLGAATASKTFSVRAGMLHHLPHACQRTAAGARCFRGCC
jgi:hypothetical protein